MDVDATAISVNGCALPGEIGRSAKQKNELAELAALRGGAMGSAEVSRGHSRFEFAPDRRPTSRKERNFHFDGEGDADKEGREAQISW